MAFTAFYFCKQFYDVLLKLIPLHFVRKILWSKKFPHEEMIEYNFPRYKLSREILSSKKIRRFI